MPERWKAPGGWRVEVVRLTGTPDRHDGEWIRVHRCGFWQADVASVDQLAELIPLDQLEADALAAA